MVVMRREAHFAETRGKVRIGDFTYFIRSRETRAAELFRVFDRGDVRRARLARASQAVLE